MSLFVRAVNDLIPSVGQIRIALLESGTECLEVANYRSWCFVMNCEIDGDVKPVLEIEAAESDGAFVDWDFLNYTDDCKRGSLKRGPAGAHSPNLGQEDYASEVVRHVKP